MQAVARAVVEVAVCGAGWGVRVVEPAIPVARAPEAGGGPLPGPVVLPRHGDWLGETPN